VRRRLRRGALATALLAVVLLLSLNCCATPLREEPVTTHAAPLTTDAQLELARAYAPAVYQAVDPEGGRQDLPTRVDFDGTMRGDDNWETFPRFALPPVVYYAVLRTRTHLFITFHLFHPRDWEPVRLGVNDTHENDGENLQVVVDRASGRVVLLFTQAHYFGAAHWSDGSGFADGEDEEREARLLLVDDEGVPSPEGRHAAVYVEPRGHGILGALDEDAGVTIAEGGAATFAEAGITLLPARQGEQVVEPAPGATRARYALESTTAKLWPGVRDGTLLGEDGLYDGACELTTAEGTVAVPRYYEADRFSGPLGADRGISPFALDWSFWSGELGALFFDPARRYAATLGVPSPWSTEYEEYPFRR
jgi:hypothetical protein